MANPQPDKFTRISNEILEVIFKKKLSGQELQLILFIIRKTYGFNKKEDYISLSQIAKALDISVVRSSQLINKLQQRKIITLKENIKGSTKKYSFNKDYELWTTLNKKIQCIKRDRTLNQKRKRHLRKSESTKETITKETITKEIYIVLLDFWNSIEKRGLAPKHEQKGEIWKDIKKSIDKLLEKKEPIEVIKQAIIKYFKILSEEKYFFKYAWRLDQFLKQKNAYGVFKQDFKILHNNYLRKEYRQEDKFEEAKRLCEEEKNEQG